jgi:hypothetical protein
MTSRDFAFWLQGLFEGNKKIKKLGKKKTAEIKRHLHMVFVHEIMPSFPEEHQEALVAAHDGVPTPTPTPSEEGPVERIHAQEQIAVESGWVELSSTAAPSAVERFERELKRAQERTKQPRSPRGSPRGGILYC